MLSDLAGTNFSVGQSSLQAPLNRAIQGITSESRRIAVPITPVNPNGDELYHILRRRLFESVGPDPEVQRIAAAYREALREAQKMGLTTTVPESLFTRVIDSYPFHPDLRELLGKFKENEGFQQTRGVIRLMQMVVSSLWNSKKADGLDLIHPYDLDLNLDEIATLLRFERPQTASGSFRLDRLASMGHQRRARISSKRARTYLLMKGSSSQRVLHCSKNSKHRRPVKLRV
jgi:predicted AAA+ superfamily ATPase